MNTNKPKAPSQYTCNEYRQEMILLALNRRLQQDGLKEKEREKLLKDISALEKEMGL